MTAATPIPRTPSGGAWGSTERYGPDVQDERDAQPGGEAGGGAPDGHDFSGDLGDERFGGTPTGGHDAPPVGRTRTEGLRSALEWAAIIVAALVVAVVVRTFLVQAFYIPSGSMARTLNPNDRVLVNKLSYRLHDVNRGDIVVFERPDEAGTAEPEIKDLIKRVVALPGDTVEGRDGRVWVNDRPLTEPYLRPGVTTTTFGEETLGDEEYFVMGDNRGASRDSRVFGPIDEGLIVGRAFVRVWPIPQFDLL